MKVLLWMLALWLAYRCLRYFARKGDLQAARQGTPASGSVQVAEASVAPDHAEAFFKDSKNFVAVPLDAVVASVGPAQAYDDWDWGRCVYEWKNDCFRIRMVTRGGYASSVEFLDPKDGSRFGTVLETVWDRDKTMSTPS